MKTGAHGSWKWLETDHRLRDFMLLLPEVILNKYIAITAVDSGAFIPSARDRAAGWTSSGDIAYSCRLDEMNQIPLDRCGRCDGFDEWYIYDAQPRPLGAISDANPFEAAIAPPQVFRFINFPGFCFSDLAMNPVADLFWQQLEWMLPESYVGDGNKSLVFVSSNDELFRRIQIDLQYRDAEETWLARNLRVQR